MIQRLRAWWRGASRRARIRVAIVFAVVMVIVIQLLGGAQPTPTSSGPDYAAIDEFVRGEIADSHIPGMAVAIAHNGAVVHLGGFGTADASGRPVTLQTQFVIGSLSKSFTALAVMKLVDAGKVALDSPVQDYLPTFRVADADASRRITVRQLLMHTSGIPTQAGTAPLSGPVTSLASQVDSLQRVATSSAPGSSFAYSNANYLVLGRLIEVVSGQSYAEYLRANVLSPLGMNRTTASLTPPQADELSAAHQLYFGYPLERKAFYRPDFVPAGWIVSTAEDMGHYLVAQLGGAAIVSREALDEMHRGAVEQPGPYGQRWGLGWVVGPRNGVPLAVWHDGSSYDMHSIVQLVPEQGWGVALLTNGEALPYALMQRTDLIADAIMARLLGLPPKGTLSGLYIAFDLFVVVLIAIQLRAIVRWWRRPRPAIDVRLLPALIFDGVLPLIALVFGWSALNAASPVSFAITDVGAFVDAYAVLRLVTLAVRLTPRSAAPRSTLISNDHKAHFSLKH